MQKRRGVNVQLSIRLQALADFVPQDSHVIDVGTDHAHIPIYLVKNKIATNCIATDINAGPLEKAARNMKAYNVTNIKLVQTNGLQGLEEDFGDVIMISGMGGYLITEILKASPMVVKRAKRLILQPQQDADVVRHFLHEHDFCIKEENFVKDEEKYYNIMCVEPGQAAYKKEYEYKYGKCLIEKPNEVFKEWLKQKEDKLQTIYASLQNKETASAKKRREEIKAELEMHQEVMRH